MTREDADAEAREQVADQRRERAAWCREKLGNLRDWLPVTPAQPTKEGKGEPECQTSSGS